MLHCGQRKLPGLIKDVIKILLTTKSNFLPKKVQQMVSIQITPKGAATTDYDAARHLHALFPKSSRISQDVIVAAEKFLARSGGLFSTDKLRKLKLIDEIQKLDRALISEVYPRIKTTANFSGRVLGFLDVFAQIFPNWQEVYVFLNEFIPSEFGAAVKNDARHSEEVVEVCRHDLTADNKYIVPCPQCGKRMKIPTGKRLSIICSSCTTSFVRMVKVA